jgi:hypothetical protein
LIYSLSRDWHLEFAALNNQNRPWSPEDDKLLLDLIENKGKPRFVAAAALKRSKKAVVGRLRVLRASSRIRDGLALAISSAGCRALPDTSLGTAPTLVSR